jgi:glycosyltransferase involved in cell wall biosynthesis
VKSSISITLVIPVRNEVNTFERLWESINAQSVQPDQIIFVEAGSTDGTPESIKKWTEGDKRVSVIQVSNAMPGVARNIGIEAARFEWIALTDCGIKLDPCWLQHLREVVSENPIVDVVYGNYNPLISSFFEECAAFAYVPRQWSNVQTNYESIRAPFIASSLLRKRVWEEVGGFSSWRAAEDIIFMQKVEHIGCKVSYAPKANVTWQLRSDLKSTFQKFFLYSIHNVWAGVERYWHYGVLKHYLVYLTLSGFYLLVNDVDKSKALLLLFILFAIGYFFRAVKSYFVKQELKQHYNQYLYNSTVIKLGLIMYILFVIDVAMFSGWIYALINKHRNA